MLDHNCKAHAVYSILTLLHVPSHHSEHIRITLPPRKPLVGDIQIYIATYIVCSSFVAINSQQTMHIWTSPSRGFLYKRGLKQGMQCRMISGEHCWCSPIALYQGRNADSSVLKKAAVLHKKHFLAVKCSVAFSAMQE